jgi:hypothetical protein
MAVSVAALSVPHGLAAQDVAARLSGRAPATVIRVVQEIAQDASARGLPVEPLIQKALEGGAKGVPPDRVIAAVRLLVTRLDDTRAALRDAGIAAPSVEALEGGADAINAGLTARQVRDLGRVSRPPYDPALTLRIAATLTALGVPAPQGVQLVRHMIQSGRAPNELLDLPNEIQVGMARGATAAEAAEALDVHDDMQGQQGAQGQHGQEGEGRPRKP